MDKWKKIVPGEMILPLLLAIVCNTLVYNGSRIVTSRMKHYDLSCWLDEKIPFLPWTITIYLGCYLFWAVNYVIASRQKKELAYRFLSADIFAKLICLFFFLLLPTTNVRPVIEGNTIFHTAMQFLYQIDAADNLFPSIHCLTSWFCYIAVRDNEKIPKWYRRVSLGIAVAICISTLTTKQHVLVDVAGGILLAEGSYYLVEKIGLVQNYRRMNEKRWSEIKR